ncbi:hypothetical protein BGZ73_002916 [Actinomortierella ambigua]|nr:hypothetical protein BGZ73_002916 [Actinomortierella ambigua]
MSPMQGQHQCSASQQQPSSKGDSEKHRPTIHSYELHYPHHDLHLQYGHGAWEHENDDDRVHPLLPTTTSPHSPACTTFMSNASAASSSPFTSSASSSFSSTCSFLVPSSSPRDPHATAMDSAVPYASLDTLPHQKQHQFLRQEQQQPLHEPVLERTLSSAVAASMTPTIASRYPLEKPSIGAAHEAVSTLSTPSTPHEATRPTLIPQGQDSRRERFQAQPMARQFSSSSSSSSISSSAPMSPTTQTLVERTECETSFISHPWTAAKSSSNSSASSTSSSSLASSYAKVGLQWAYLPTLEDTQAAAPSPSSSIATVDPDDRHHPHTAATTAATTPSPWSSTPHRRCLWPPESTMITSSTPSTFNTVVSPKHVGTSTQPNRSASPPSSPRATLSASMARSRISQAAAERMQPEYLYPNIDSQILFLPSGSSHSSSGGNIRSNRATLINPRSMVREENLAAAGISPLGSSDQGRFGEHPPGSQSDLLWQHRQRNIIEASQPQYLQQRLRALEIQEVKIMQRRRQQDEPTYRERNNAQVRCLIQEAVEHGIGEIDLSNHELDDLPPDIVDLSCAIIHNERGSLLCNKLQLYLSYNLFTTVPKSIFSLKNLSVLSLRNNHLTEIPPEIGLLQNLVELSIGGNQLGETGLN